MLKAVVSASDVTKRFGETVALNRVSLEIMEGEILGLVGPNGAGKTTLAKSLIGLLDVDNGEILYFGIPLKKNFSSLKKSLSIVPQESSFYYGFTVKQNLVFFSALYGLNTKETEQRALDLMKWLKLTRFSGRKASLLSGGYKRLLNIGCSLVNNPTVLFLDEPTVGLDPKMRRLMWRKISELRDNGKTIILTTHYMDEAEQLCDRVALMSEGKIAVIAPPRELIRKHGGKTQLILKLSRAVDTDLLDSLKKNLPEISVKSFGSDLILQVKETELKRVMVKSGIVLEQTGYSIRSSAVKTTSLEDVFMHLLGDKVEA